MCEEIILPIIFASNGLLFIGISIPLVLEKIPPNDWYGFRTSKTFSDKVVWYKANKYMGKELIWLGGILIAYNLALLLFQPIFICYEPIINLILLTGGVLVVIIRSYNYLRKL